MAVVEFDQLTLLLETKSYVCAINHMHDLGDICHHYAIHDPSLAAAFSGLQSCVRLYVQRQQRSE